MQYPLTFLTKTLQQQESFPSWHYGVALLLHHLLTFAFSSISFLSLPITMSFSSIDLRKVGVATRCPIWCLQAHEELHVLALAVGVSSLAHLLPHFNWILE
ncbi:hypothetical protein QYF36_022123 [Acer negundo]|nr:hypothetical protein QYF36_022123 [Acer negundo]